MPVNAWRFGRRQSTGHLRRLCGRGRMLRRLALSLALFFFHYFFAEFALSGKGTAVNDAKRIFLLGIGEGTFLNN